MTITLTITLEELKRKYTELGAMIKAYEEQQEEAEFPEAGDLFYYITVYGRVVIGNFCEGHDEKVLSIGNCFRTKEEAEFAVEQLKVIAEMKRCGGVWKTKSAGVKGYYIYYAAMNNPVLNIGIWTSKDSLPYIWFPTEAQAQKAIDTIGKERLLKYWFCVEV